MNLLFVAVFFIASILIGPQISVAEEEHHQPADAVQAPESAAPATGTPESSKDGGMAGMMSQPAEEKEQASQGMITELGEENEQELTQGLMKMMDKGMMRMMMSHMMGGPSGMGKMMGKMKAGMKGRRKMESMTKMLGSLNLTPTQWDQVRALARRQMDNMVDLWAQRMKLQIDLASLSWDKEIDPQQVKNLFIKEAEAKADLLLSGLEYLRGLKGILSPEQFKKLEGQGL